MFGRVLSFLHNDTCFGGGGEKGQATKEPNVVRGLSCNVEVMM